MDSAIWDAVGKLAGEPLWRLWGGYRDRIPMIGIGGYYGSSEADLERELGFFRDEQGMVGMKFKIGAKPPAEDAARLRQARDIVGPAFLFVVDANQGYRVSEALEFLAAWTKTSPFAGSRSRRAGMPTGADSVTFGFAVT